MTGKRLAVVGAGPMGLSAALLAARRGWDVKVLEQGEVGEALRRWGPTRLFTPLGMNIPACAREDVRGLPAEEAFLTGPAMVAEVLEPLAAGTSLAGRVLTRHRVVSIARAGLTRQELAGHPLRAERGFVLMVEGPSGETTLEADAVLDASGACARPAWAGRGGIPAAGERAAGDAILRHLGDLHASLGAMRGTRILLVGHGHSAANAVLALAETAGRAEGTRITWAVRASHARPVPEVADDPLPERRRVVSAANDLAQSPPPFLTMKRSVWLSAIHRRPATFEVSFGRDAAAVPFDHVAAFTGYRPDTDMVSELALEISPATEGAARLARALGGVTDCLAVPRVCREDLRSGEPGFHMVGARSYGRSRTFLMRTGLTHIETILESQG